MVKIKLIMATLNRFCILSLSKKIISILSQIKSKSFDFYSIPDAIKININNILSNEINSNKIKKIIENSKNEIAILKKRVELFIKGIGKSINERKNYQIKNETNLSKFFKNRTLAIDYIISEKNKENINSKNYNNNNKIDVKLRKIKPKECINQTNVENEILPDEVLPLIIENKQINKYNSIVCNSKGSNDFIRIEDENKSFKLK